MALFLGVHDMGMPMAEADLTASWDNYKNACGKHNCTPVQAYVSGPAGKAFCVTEAATSDEVQAAHDEAKVPLKEIVPVTSLE
jgi:hypothetical protein